MTTQPDPPTFELNDADLEVTTGCDAAHPDHRGGQHVAMRCCAVRIMHRPTGIGVLANDERSQFSNRKAAMQRLQTVLDALRTARVIP